MTNILNKFSFSNELGNRKKMRDSVGWFLCIESNGISSILKVKDDENLLIKVCRVEHEEIVFLNKSDINLMVIGHRSFII